MKYLSTRGGVKNKSFEEALFSGFLSDGGIMLPETFPRLDQQTIKAWSTLSYSDLVKKIVPYFISEEEISHQDLSGLIDKAFSRFSIPEVVRVERLKDDLSVLELFHGPTMAFKDLALSLVGQLYGYFLNKRKRHVNVIIGTSGDTGSAALESVRGMPWVDIVVLLPKGRCSRIQQLQMTTVIEDNVHLFAVDGTSDDLDMPIREVFKDAEFAEKHNLSSINSINWARILVQIAHYFYAYYQMRPECDDEAEIIIPTGACGNVTSGLVAVQMGLPVKLTCTVNKNDIVARTLSTGDFSVSNDVIPSLAPAMDIQVPYNVERLIYILSNGDVDLVKRVQHDFETSGKANIPDAILQKMKSHMSSHVVDDAGIKAAMQKCWMDNKYLLCPHTAIAVKYHYDTIKNSKMPRICIATASPAKFEEAVKEAGLEPQPTDAIKRLDTMPEKYEDMKRGENWELMLREKIISISNKQQPEK